MTIEQARKKKMDKISGHNMTKKYEEMIHKNKAIHTHLQNKLNIWNKNIKSWGIEEKKK